MAKVAFSSGPPAWHRGLCWVMMQAPRGQAPGLSCSGTAGGDASPVPEAEGPGLTAPLAFQCA